MNDDPLYSKDFQSEVLDTCMSILRKVRESDKSSREDTLKFSDSTIEMMELFNKINKRRGLNGEDREI